MRLSSTLAGTILVLTLAACGQPDPLEYSKSQLELHQAQQAAQLAAARAEALEPVSRFASTAWYVALGVLPILVLGIGIDAYVQRRRPMVRPDHLGQLPAPRAMIDSGDLAAAMVEALAAYHRTQALAAAQPRVDKLNLTVKEPSIPQLPPCGMPQINVESTPTPLSLPSIVELADVLPTVRSGHLAFGMLPNGELLQLPFGRAYHFLGAGDTRTGKTVMLDSLIVQLHHMAKRLPLTLYGGDFKRELAATWSSSPVFAIIETQSAAIADMLVELVEGPDGVHRRYDQFKHEGQLRGRIIRNIGDWRSVTGELPQISVVVLDEINAVLEAAKRSERVAASLKVLLQTGAGAGVYVLGGAQYLSSAVFSRDGSKQFVSRCLFGQYDDTAARMMFGSVDSAVRLHIDGTPGRGLIRTVAQQQPQPFQALHAREQDILDAIATVSTAGNVSTPTVTTGNTALERAEMTPEAASVTLPTVAESRHKPALQVQQTATTDVPDIERAQILALAKAGVSRRKIGEIVYGTVGGRGYAAVKQTLDVAGL